VLITDKETLKNYVASKCIWQGVPGIEVTPKGRTFLTFYSGGTKEEIGNFVLLIKSDDGVHFSDPIAVCYEENHRCFDPCLWIDPLGRLWMTWSRQPEPGLYGAICDDPDADEIVFGEEFFIGNNIMMNKPIVLSTGEWAFPLAVWSDNLGAPSAWISSEIPKASHMYVTSDEGKSFQRLGCADVKNRCFDEHMFLEKDNGVIRVFVRTFYGIGAADSYDGGLHWGKDFDTGFGGPNSRFCIRRLPSGRVLLINHYNFTGRNNLTAMLSEDDDETFPYRLLLDERGGVSYPDATVTPDGRIYITYDRERGGFCSRLEDVMNSAREILTACITEDDILNGKLVSEGSYTKRVAYKLTDYDGAVQNPFHENSLFSDSEYADYICQIGNAEDVMEEVFNAYPINCTNVHNLDAEQLDLAVEEYKKTNDLMALNRIISIVRSARTESEYSEKGIVNDICKYIVEHLETNFTVETIAKNFHFSSHYIRHLFKKETGISISMFTTAQRIKKAKLLLKATENSISDIADVCGFENISYFSEYFIKNVGVTPTDYRKKFRRS